MVGTVGEQYSILGLSFFSAYHIVVDRDIGKVSFKVGCGCEQATDSYPAISTSGSTIDPPLAPFTNPTRPANAPATYKADTQFQGGYTWQSKIFAPLVDTSAGAFDIVKMSNTVGTARYILGFITSLAADGSPSWNGKDSISTLPNLNEIQAVRYFGGDVIISFGGPSGVELANAAPKLNSLINSYQNVLYGYSASWLDFYLVGASLDPPATDLRNQALRAMQKSDPNPRFSFTLPVVPSGLTSASISALQSAISNGVRIDAVNIVASGFVEVNQGTLASTLVQMSARGARKQLLALGITVPIGIIIRPGGTPYFTLSDAKVVLEWAKSVGWVGVVSCDAQSDVVATPTAFSFSSVFVQFEN